MGHVDRADSRFAFYRPFFETRRGQIFGLATPSDHLRDGLALAQLSRLFPLSEFDGIVVEPARPTIQPAENIILVGSARLFLRPDAHRISGSELPLSLGEERLGERLRKIHDECCYRLVGGEHRAVRNEVTGELYRPQQDEVSDREVDFGVIRRLFRGPTENTIVVEGLHRLGTLGAAKVATSPLYLDAVWDAARSADDFDESVPLEILVCSVFHPKLHQNLYALETIKAVPLTLVYNRRWLYDMVDGHRWRDQLPWDVQLLMEGEQPPRPVDGRKDAAALPRLQVQAHLCALDRATRELCRALWLPQPRQRIDERDAARLLTRLTAESDRFRIELIDEAPWGKIRIIELPQGQSAIRRLRKQFMVHMALCRALGRAFPCDDTTVRRYFPKFMAGSSSKPLATQFIGSVPGKLRDGFEPLLGPARQRKDYLQIECRRKLRSYELRLDRAALLLKLRL